MLRHQILLHRYFFGTNFLRAEPGNKPSFTWQSLLRVQDLMVPVLRWKIGDGQSALIVGQPGSLGLEPSAGFQTPNPEQWATIAKLNGPDFSWNVGVIKSEFRDIDANCILSIPLNEAASPDEIIWHFERKGNSW
ncbi:hypothetical protein Salat_1692400 [Sesamum alatum]|uniref:Uncharacterized protein n=1 Tax=Sesamum alatum TaxID=300844 RepID=A0AAE1Y7A3_9LAMI|nr:hypothetical protein Salat_1692400 [Sesamum alatum]